MRGAIVSTTLEAIGGMESLPDLCTVPIIARYTGVSIPTLNRWAAVGQGPKRIKLGHAVRYRKADVLAWIEEQAKVTA